MTTSESDGLRDEEVTIDEELVMIESSDISAALAAPQSDWSYDPLDAELDEVRLRSVLGAVEGMEEVSLATEPDLGTDKDGGSR